MVADNSSFLESRHRQFYPKADIELTGANLKSLTDRPSPFEKSELYAAIASKGLSVSSLQPLAKGTFHELFQCVDSTGTRWVLKANRIADLVRDFGPEVEAIVSRQLRSQEIEHATVVGVDCSRHVVDFEFQVMKYLPGVSFRSFDDDEGAVEDHLPALARYLRGCHEIVGEGFGLVSNQGTSDAFMSGVNETWSDYLSRQVDRHIRVVRNAGIISNGQVSDIRRALFDLNSSKEEVSPRLLHGDCGPHNAIVSPDGGIGMFDWEDAVLGDPLFEVALWATFNPPRRWKWFFQGYFEAAWEPNFLFWAYFLRISLAKTVVRIRFGYHDVPGREPAHERIHRALHALAQS